MTIYGMGELNALNRSEITRIKQFISSQEDRFRASFDRRPKDCPCQGVFIGTTNEDHYLIDPTGNRRFWPVQVSRQIDLAWLQQHRKLFNPQQQQRTVENAIESAISHYLYPARTAGGPRNDGHALQQCTLVELLAKVGIGIEKLGPGRYHEKQAAAALRKLGWTEHKSSRPGRPRVYRRPPAARDIPATEPTPAHITEDADACPV